jgi:hypothetical protein
MEVEKPISGGAKTSVPIVIEERSVELDGLEQGDNKSRYCQRSILIPQEEFSKGRSGKAKGSDFPAAMISGHSHWLRLKVDGKGEGQNG